MNGPVEQVVLTGFMGAGKSTVGALLARRLEWPFFDADSVLEAKHGLSIAEIFRQHGEGHFRSLEESTVETLLTHRPSVLALGGGALESVGTQGRMAALVGAHVVFLETPLAVAVARCGPRPADRPVLADREMLEQRYAARMPLYRRAHQTIDTTAVAPEDVVRLIVAAVCEVRKGTP